MYKNSDNYTKIQNSILDALIANRISGRECQIVLFIIRKTNGYHKECDDISMGQISKATGISRSKVSSILTSLCEKNIITVTQKGNTKINCLSLQQDVSLWRVLPKKGTVTQKGNTLFPKKVTPVTQKGNTATIIKKTRQKKIIQKKEFEPPSLKDVINFFIENGYPENTAIKAWKYYAEDANPIWHDQYGKPVLNWKQKFRAVWFKDYNKPTMSEKEKRQAEIEDYIEIRK